ncbi:hypothetical protein [Roseimaritima ulvae]|uniref:DUF4350 domain-containing protein n=1 Tax=Roseimaritima ulvae TaxID=980254 RepID=A0A5B9R1K2_9BACT|nr:hypothetical protein [Roseimaritima ulvae]QEG43296.1 hypothetical protein UC8_53430 [Roseimaritima ulvae]
MNSASRSLSSFAPLHAIFILVWCGLSSVAAAAPQASAEPQTPAAPQAPVEPASDSLQWAFDGQFRVGQWTGVRIVPGQQEGAAGKDATDPWGELELETIDGDGVRVRYRDQGPQAGSYKSPWRYVVPSATSAPLLLRDAAGNVLQRTRFPDQAIAVEQRRVLVLGDPMGIDQIGRNEMLGRDATLATAVIRDPQRLPDHWIGYESIDTLVITATASPMLAELSEPVIDAIVGWVQRGGSVLVTIGDSGAEAYQRSSLIRRLVPFESEPLSLPMEPAPIEAFTSAQQRLEDFNAVVLPFHVGQPLLVGRTVERRPMAMAMQYRVGLGQVVAIAADLDQAPFADWPRRTDLILGVMSGLIPEDQDPSSGRATHDANYTDIAGQLRATLDRFPSDARIPFSVVAFSLVGLFFFIGPLDYLLVNRWLKRPLVGWLTFPLLILASSVFLVYWSTRDDGQQTRTNHIEIVDINAITKTGRGFRTDYLFSPQAGRFDMQLDIAEGFQPAVDSERLSGPLLSPFGYSGSTYGGIQVNVEDQRLPAYQIVLDRSDRLLGSRVEQAPLASGSSKGFTATWSFDFRSPVEQGLQRLRRRELAGSLVNPLPVDVLDGMILDRDKVYMLPSRFRAGATISRVEDLRPRVLRWLLTGRKKTDDSTVSKRWEPADDSDIERVGEVLAFYNIAGGESYTGLSNEPLRRLDLSEILTDDRALLIGKLEQPSTSLAISQQQADGTAVAVDATGGQTVSMVRVLLPVEVVRTGK